MIVIVSSRHLDVTPPLKAYAEQKVSKLTRYYDRIAEIEVVFDAEKTANCAEIIVHAEKRDMLIARHCDADAYACIDACVDKLERQLTDHKEKIRNRKHPVGDVKRDMRPITDTTNLGEAV